jgi:hypothetical protein
MYRYCGTGWNGGECSACQRAEKRSKRRNSCPNHSVGVVGVALRPIFHLGGFLGARVPVFEIRDTGGEATDMLVRNPELGAALAKTLGTAPVR